MAEDGRFEVPNEVTHVALNSTVPTSMVRSSEKYRRY